MPEHGIVVSWLDGRGSIELPGSVRPITVCAEHLIGAEQLQVGDRVAFTVAREPSGRLRAIDVTVVVTTEQTRVAPAPWQLRSRKLKACPACGTTFETTTNPRQVYCRPSCARPKPEHQLFKAVKS
jgi:hypothetical protein